MTLKIQVSNTIYRVQYALDASTAKSLGTAMHFGIARTRLLDPAFGEKNVGALRKTSKLVICVDPNFKSVDLFQ